VTENTDDSTDEADTQEESDGEAVVVRIGGMSGPTSMGLVKLMDDAENGETANIYEFADLATEASAFVAPLSNGELDIAAVPSNLASVLYNNTDGGIQVLAINNLCVLNIVERGDTVQSMEDLKGKKIYATGEGATPEYTLRYLLKAYNVDPDSDLEIQWCSDTTEALSYVTNDEEAIAMLPQPFVTAALSQVEDLRVALDLNDVWTELDNGCEQITGVIVVRKEFAEQNPEAVDTFLSEYEASMTYTQENVEDAAALIEKYGIVGKAAIAQKALPGCHLNYEAGNEMKESLEGFLQILYDENPAAVGGSLPETDFYYGI
jgi:NitT/TauT family transport system substrate-binding protein